MARPIAVGSGKVEVTYAELPRTVAFDGSASTADPGRTITAYLWIPIEIPEGSTAVLDDPTLAAPSLTVDRPGNYLFKLRVTDSEAELSDVDVSTMPSSAMSHVEVPTEHMSFVVPAWEQRLCARAQQRDWHALDAEIGLLRARLDALEAP